MSAKVGSHDWIAWPPGVSGHVCDSVEDEVHTPVGFVIACS